ncbi:MAG: VTC domain-containing protein [Phycisphaerales bacterium]|nr:VTC domain-containing protein [Phycisphaerales bacterium]
MPTTLLEQSKTQTARTLGLTRLAPSIAALAARLRNAKRHAPTAPDHRYEIKFTVPIAYAHRINAWLRAHPAGFRKLYPARQVNSLYLDSIELASYTQNLSGVAERGKLRLRWYGAFSKQDAGDSIVVQASCLHQNPTAEDIHCNDHATNDRCISNAVLEMKCKQGMLGWKELHRVDHDFVLTGAKWRDVLRQLRATLPEQTRLALDRSPRPIVVIHYQRSYHASADGIVRVTVDRELRAFDQRRGPRPNFRHALPIPDHAVVELKCAAEHHDRLAEIAAAFPGRIERCSKYVTAVATALRC